MNDRHRCEISFISRIVYLLILGGLQTNNTAHHQELAQLALDASNEPFDGLTDAERVKLKRRVMRMEESTLRPLNGKSHGEKIILIAYHFINELVERDYLSMPEGSRQAMITDYLLRLVDLEDEVVQKRFDSAKKQSRHWLTALQNEGYYK